MDSSSSARHTVSVILPAYNVGPWIEPCIESLKKQELPGLEFIFVDDCSTDDTLERIQAFAREDDRVRVIRNEKNSGAGPTRNRGIEEARGEYLSFIDPDDWVSERFYEELYTAAVAGDFDIVKGARAVVEREGGKQGFGNLNRRIRNNNAKGMPLYFSFTYEHQSAIYKASLFADGTARYGTSRNSQDTTFLLKVCSKTESFELVEGPVYYYLKRPGAATYGYSMRRSLEELKALEERIDFLENESHADMKAQYIQGRMMEWMKTYLTNFYYATQEEDGSGEDKERFVEGLRHATERLERLSGSFQGFPELGPLLSYGHAIPVHMRKGEPVFLDGVREWAAFFAEHGDALTEDHYAGYAIASLRSLAAAYRSRKAGSMRETASFLHEQMAPLSLAQRMKIRKKMVGRLLFSSWRSV